jgi:phage protein D
MNRDAAVIASRPVFELDGQAQPELAAQLLALDIRDEATGLARCEAEFGNWGLADGRVGFRYFDRRLLEFGRSLVVKLGDDTLFQGRILGLQGRFGEGTPPSIRVLADDRLQDLRMTRRTRSFEDLSDEDLARRIAQDHGLTPRVGAAGPRHRHLAQVNQSDLAFLHERARAIDAELWVQDGTLHFEGRGAREAGRVALNWGAGLRRFDVTADLAHQRTEVAASGWDVGAKQALRATAGAAVLGAELGGDESGIAILQQSLGERRETLAHGAVASEAEARALAEAALRLAARRFVRGQGTAEPTPALRVGTALQLGGLGPLFDGRYVATGVHHRFCTAHGLRTDFEAERAGLGRP